MNDNGDGKMENMESPLIPENKHEQPAIQTEPIDIITIKQDPTGEIKLYTKLIPPLLIYNMVLMLFSVVNNTLHPQEKKNVIVHPNSNFSNGLRNFLRRK